MKLNRLLFGLSLVPAALLTGCGDYEDVEIASPEADAEAVGAYFASDEQAFTLTPEEGSFPLVLDRANSENGTTVKVTTVKADDAFTNIPAEFQFAGGEMESAVANVGYDKTKIAFQETDTLVLQIPAKDHPYADGYTSSTVTLTVDYEWTDAVSAVVVEDDYIGHAETDKFLVTVQIAKDFDVDKTNPKHKTLVRIADLYTAAGKAKTAGFAHLQFTMDDDYTAGSTALLASADIENMTIRTELETGMTESFPATVDGEEVTVTLPVYMEVKGISCSDEGGDSEVLSRKFTVTSELYVKYENKEYQVKTDELTLGRTANQTAFTVDFPKPVQPETPVER